jgi:hypothetical protein
MQTTLRRLLKTLSATVLAVLTFRWIFGSRSSNSDRLLPFFSFARGRFDPVYMGRLYEEFEKYQNVYDWLRFGERASEAIKKGEALPSNPRSPWSTDEIIKRLDGLKRFASGFTVTPEPPVANPDSISQVEQLAAVLRHGIAAHQADLHNIEHRLAKLAEIRRMMVDFKRGCAAGAKGIKEALDRGVPDPGRILEGAWFDFSETLPKRAVEVEREVDRRIANLEKALATRKKAYADWEGRAKARLEQAQYEEARRKALNALDSGRDAARAAGRGVRPTGNSEPSGVPQNPPPQVESTPRPRPARPARPNTGPPPTLGGGVLGLISASSPDLPVDLEFWFIPPELYVLRPPEEPGLEVPDGASVLLLPTFVGLETSIDVWAETPEGDTLPIMTWAGSCGAFGRVLLWYNHTGDTVVIRAAGYQGIFETPKKVEELPRVARSDQLLSRELAVFGWGYRPPPPPPQKRGATMNDAALVIVRTDSPGTVIEDRSGEPSAVFDPQVGRWTAGLIFPNELTRVEFDAREKSGAPAWFPLDRHQNGWAAHYLYNFTLENPDLDRTEVTAVARHGERPLRWRSVWLNPFLYVAGAGFAPGNFADTDTPYRAIFFAVQIDETACE